jgi:argininosuccinate synthase
MPNAHKAAAARVVLAYAHGSGAGDAVPWLRTSHQAEVVAVTVDLGAGRELEAVRDRALAAGAARAHVMDAREEFARQFLLPALKAGALDDLAALARPLLAKKLVEVAVIEHARSVAAAPELRRLIGDLEPALEFVTMPDAIAGPAAAPVSRAAGAPPPPAVAEIAFDQGTPAALNGIPMSLPDLIASLGIIAAPHGIDAVAPVLQTAHQHLQERCIDGDLARVTANARAEYSALVRDGRWFTPLRAALDALIGEVQKAVTGTVAFDLHNGSWSLDHG